MSPSVNRN